MKRLVARKFERKRFIGEAVIRPLLDGAPLVVHVLDLGEGGVALFSSQSLPTGQLVKITFRVGPDAARAGLDQRDGHVVRSRAHPDGNVMNVAFARPLTVDELKLLETSWVRS